jgi:DNA-binding NarL/FixJ family response regulator
MSWSAPNPPRKTALVDDDLVYRNFVTSLLQQMPEVELVHSWESAEAMLADMRFHEVELLFVDLELPGLGGLGLISQINQMDDAPLCVVLTSSRDAEDVFTAIRNGASGYIIKSGDPRTFQESLKQMIHDRVSLSPEIARLLVAEFRQKEPTSTPAKKTHAIQCLTERELEVLNGLARLGSAKEVALDLELSHETVRVHMKKIYQKLHVNSKAEALALLDKERGVAEQVRAQLSPIA